MSLFGTNSVVTTPSNISPPVDSAVNEYLEFFRGMQILTEHSHIKQQVVQGGTLGAHTTQL